MWTNEWICMGKCVCKFVIAPYVQHIRFVTHTYWPLRARCAFATLDISSVFFFLSFAFYCCFSLLWFFFFCAFSLFMRMMNRIFVPPASAITSFHKMVQFSFQCEWRKVKSLLCRRDNLLHVSNLLSRYGLCDIQPFIAQHQFHRFSSSKNFISTIEKYIPHSAIFSCRSRLLCQNDFLFLVHQLTVTTEIF